MTTMTKTTIKVCAYRDFPSDQICGRPSGNHYMQWCPLHPAAATVEIEPPTQPERALGEHTPLPWHVAHDEIDGDEIVAENGLSIAMVYGTYKRLNPHNDSAICHANAQLIVTAVNNHAQLVAALEDELEAISVWQSARGVPADIRDGLQISTEKIRAVLSRVRG